MNTAEQIVRALAQRSRPDHQGVHGEGQVCSLCYSVRCKDNCPHRMALEWAAANPGTILDEDRHIGHIIGTNQKVYVCKNPGCRTGYVLPKPGFCEICRRRKYGDKLREVRTAACKTLGQMSRHLGLGVVETSGVEQGKVLLSAVLTERWLDFSEAMTPELLTELMELAR